ncbi:hypothetical protein CDAR_218271 [Caerostris darwini]|uniref:Secreted protein n=1 Tax=Caerostris darwini TaxID=1538125 RepID=A0AAV4R7B2_9ARAC|nr:hypothetical protein CDAR_218271 [Caerostris darwini]
MSILRFFLLPFAYFFFRSPVFHSVTKDVEKPKVFLNKFSIFGLLSLGEAVKVFCPKNTRKKEPEKSSWMRGDLGEKDEESRREVGETRRKEEMAYEGIDQSSPSNSFCSLTLFHTFKPEKVLSIKFKKNR